jgi:hypothetical protein
MLNTTKSIVGIICLLLAGLYAVLAVSNRTVEIDLIAPALQMDRVIAERIVELVSEESGLRINLISLPDESMSTLDALDAGLGDIAFAPNTGVYRESVSTVMPLYPSVLHIVVDEGRPSATLEEVFRDAVVYAGQQGSVPRELVDRIVSSFEFAPGDVSFVDGVDGVDVLPDVIVLYAPIDRERVLNDPRLQNVKWYSFGSPDDIGNGSPVDLAVFLNPRLRPFVIPAGTFGRFTPEPVVTLAVDKLLVARADIPESVVYDLYAEILRLRPALFSSRPELYQPIDKQFTQSNFAYSLHSGALAFLQRDEPTFVERYSGVAEVVVTLMVGLVSGMFAVMRIFRIRRKNRLDEFLVEVIEIRKALQSDSSDDERAAATVKIRDLQDKAFELLVDEKLAADDSFRIFTELSNDTINRITELRA